MAAEEEKPKHAIYGSAGMAAAGMIPDNRPKPVATEPEEAELEQNAPENEIVENGEESAESVEAVPQPAPEPDPKPEPKPEPIVPVFTGKHAVIIGHSGEGDFGNGLDKVFQRLDGVRLSALADANEEALDDSYTQAAAPVGFLDYREMLAETGPDLVCVAPSWTHQRHEMVRAAISGGGHVLCASPFTETLRDADDLLALAGEKGLHIAVAGLLREKPLISRFHEGRQALIGDLLEMHVFGEMGPHSGGEDLIANSLPLLDLARWFGGDPEFASAIIMKDGLPAIADDAHEAESRKLGPLLGDSIHATLLLESGIRVTFVSDAKMQPTTGRAGIRFVGTEATMRLYTDPVPVFSLQVESKPNEANRSDPWVQWPGAATDLESVDHLTGQDAENRRVVKNWLEAIDGDAELSCSGENAAKALEMAHGIWQSAITLKRAYFPLTNRLHPLAGETR